MYDRKIIKMGESLAGVCYDEPILSRSYNNKTKTYEIAGAYFGLEQPGGNRISVAYYNKYGDYTVTEDFPAFAWGKKIEIIPTDKGCGIYYTRILKFV